MERNSPNVGSLGQLASCGAAHIASYLDRGSTFAWCYDHPGNPEQLMPADVTATALLDYPIPPAYMRAMFCPDTGDNPYAALRVALQAVLDNQEVQHTAFEDVPREAVTDEHLHGPWGYVRQALRAVDTCEGLTAVAVSKILHRKRPWFVPLYDQQVRSFYGLRSNTPWDFWSALHDDLNAHRDLVEGWCDGYQAFDGARLSKLRAADIAIWYHRTQGCTAALASS